MKGGRYDIKKTYFPSIILIPKIRLEALVVRIDKPDKNEGLITPQYSN